jgi:ribosomal protein S18 acetylase RimI-like enzyme
MSRLVKAYGSRARSPGGRGDRTQFYAAGDEAATRLAARPVQFHIRRLREGDLGVYRALMLRAYGEDPRSFTSSASEASARPISWWKARLVPVPRGSQVIVGAFAVGGELIGTSGIAFEQGAKTNHKAMVFGLYVIPACRRAGVARALVRAVLDVAEKRRRIQGVQLTVTRRNQAARHLYEAFGFTSWGLEPLAIREGGEYEDKVHMWLDLRCR